MTDALKAVCGALMFMTLNYHRMEHVGFGSGGYDPNWMKCTARSPCKQNKEMLVDAGFLDADGEVVE